MRARAFCQDLEAVLQAKQYGPRCKRRKTPRCAHQPSLQFLIAFAIHVQCDQILQAIGADWELSLHPVRVVEPHDQRGKPILGDLDAPANDQKH
ncbi:hypothetical protein D3C71_1040920 [compost metagenome]